MMVAKRAAPEKAQPVDVVHVRMGSVKWLAGTVAAIGAGLVGWWAVADRVDNHWLTTAKAKTKFSAIDRNSTWTLYAVQDFKAAAADKWLEDCRTKQKGPNECRHLEEQAAQFKQEAADLKKEATKASKPLADE